MPLSSSMLNTNSLLPRNRFASFADSASVLTDIYQEEVNLVVWKNQISEEAKLDIAHLMQKTTYLDTRLAVCPNSTVEKLYENVSELRNAAAFCQYIELLVDMFCTLFELKQAGLRLALLNHAMCPKFHVDKIPCRLISTFSGKGTQWLPHNKVDRTKLGAGSLGIADEDSGIMQSSDNIQHLSVGDVALLKGEGWYNNENGGAVHRSPAIQKSEQRLLLTLDFID